MNVIFECLHKFSTVRSLSIGWICIALAGASACDSSEPSEWRSVQPGHGSPEAAAAGYMAAFAQNSGEDQCDYVAGTGPEASPKDCTEANDSTLNRWGIGQSLVNEDRALVVVLYERLCTGSDSDCVTNTSPTRNLPKQMSDFDDQYKARTENNPALPTILIDGRWYVYLGEP